MKRVIIFCCTLLILNFGFGQPNPTVQKYAATITEADLKENLSIIASDAMEGRETGKRGQKMAAAFIAAYFDDLGLKGPVSGSHYQPVPLYTTSAPVLAMKVGATVISSDSYVLLGSGQTDGDMNLPLVFAGKGSDADLEKLDLNGKAVMVLLESGASVMNNPVLANLRKKGATLLFVAVEKSEEFTRMSGMVRRFSGGRLSLNKPESGKISGSVIVSAEAAGKFFNTTFDKLKKAADSKKASKVKPSTLTY